MHKVFGSIFTATHEVDIVSPILEMERLRPGAVRSLVCQGQSRALTLGVLASSPALLRCEQPLLVLPLPLIKGVVLGESPPLLGLAASS